MNCCPEFLKAEVCRLTRFHNLVQCQWQELVDCPDGKWCITGNDDEISPRFFCFVGRLTGISKQTGKIETHDILPSDAPKDLIHEDDPDYYEKHVFSTKAEAELVIRQVQDCNAQAKSAYRRKEYIRSMATGSHHNLRANQSIEVIIGDTVKAAEHQSSLTVTHPDGTTEKLPHFYIRGRGCGACAVIAFAGTYTYHERVQLAGPMRSKVRTITFVVK